MKDSGVCPSVVSLEAIAEADLECLKAAYQQIADLYEEIRKLKQEKEGLQQQIEQLQNKTK